MKLIRAFSFAVVMLISAVNNTAMAHDPVFGLGPHVLFKDGYEVALEVEAEKEVDEKEQALVLDITYGLTGDWALGADFPYEFKDDGTNSNNGNGDIAIFSKYRFWRRDSLGLQESAAVLVKVISDTAADNKAPTLKKGVTDAVIGFTYGYESRKWYRWASVRYRNNGVNDAGVDRGDQILIDLVGAIRPTPTSYLEADTVWMLELNGELGERSEFGGAGLANTGGIEWFVSPGIFWTKRNFAIKAGVQIPVVQNLNDNQDASSYRAKVIFEWHL